MAAVLAPLNAVVQRQKKAFYKEKIEFIRNVVGAAETGSRIRRGGARGGEGVGGGSYGGRCWGQQGRSTALSSSSSSSTLSHSASTCTGRGRASRKCAIGVHALQSHALVHARPQGCEPRHVYFMQTRSRGAEDDLVVGWALGNIRNRRISVRFLPGEEGRKRRREE